MTNQSFTPRRWRQAAAAPWLALVLALPAMAQPTLADALGRDSEVTLQLRSYAFDRQNPGDVNNAAWALGGWAGYRSGWIGDVLRFGVVGYTSQKLWGPQDRDGSGVLAPGQQSYSVLGEGWASLKWGEQVLTAGRFQVSQPEINPDDSRMTPVTYSGGNLAGLLGGVNYYLAYLNASKPKTSEHFIDFAQAAGIGNNASAPLWLVGASASPTPDFGWKLSSYYVPDVLSSSYADLRWSTALAQDYRLQLGAQAMYQRGVGQQLLTGTPFSTWSGGLKADLKKGGATATLVYQQTGRGADYLAPYSEWAGYTSMIEKYFNLAGMKAWMLGGNYDFAAQGLPGLSLNAAAVHGHGSIDPSSGAARPNMTEYDLTLDYRFSDPRWPDWVRPLSVRGRVAHVDMRSDGAIREVRVIVGYEKKF